MRRGLFVHSVDVTRWDSTSVVTGMDCLIEPIPAIEVRPSRERSAQATHIISWGEEALKSGDRVTWGTVTFELLKIIPDISRPFSNVPPYHTAEMQQIV